MKVTLRFRDRPSLIIMRGEQPNNSNFTNIPMPSRSSQREGRPTLRSERTPKPEEPETNRGLINISKFYGPSLAPPDPTTNSETANPESF